MDALDVLAERVGYPFSDRSVLKAALAHRSWCAEKGGQVSNERLEFLGDAVLGWVVADLVYRRFPDLSEGQLTDLRKSVVNATALAEIAVELGIGPALLLGKGEDTGGGREKTSILADALEAVIGAVYLDGGPSNGEALIERLVDDRLTAAALDLGRGDHKTRLQELSAVRFETAPVYEVVGTGPDHAKVFRASASIEGRVLGHGEGRSKKAAEQDAARSALEILGVDEVTQAG